MCHYWTQICTSLNHRKKMKARAQSADSSKAFLAKLELVILVHYHLWKYVLCNFPNQTLIHKTFFQMAKHVYHMFICYWSNCFWGNRFHVILRILSPENCYHSLLVKSWKAKVRAGKANKLKTKMNTQGHKPRQVQTENSSFPNITWSLKTM